MVSDMMTAEQLKGSILQLAMQGQLLLQDSADSSVEELLKRIRNSDEYKNDKKKTKLILKNGSYFEVSGKTEKCVDEVLPFDIPNNWRWERLGNIGETNIGLTYKPSDISDKGIIVLRSGNIQNGKMSYDDVVRVKCDVPERAMIHKGDILICARNGSRKLVGKSAIVDREGMAFGAFMAKFHSDFLLNRYIQYYIESPLFRGTLDNVGTETINQITQVMLKQSFCPVPPIEEQKRIVAKIEELMPFVEQYAEASTKLNTLNATFPEMMKKSILQEAVQGKLVPQDPDDEPASVLLKKIAEEKERLIKEGKIKKQKPLPEITDDEIPFDIPESWEWVRLNDCLDVRDGTHDSPKYYSEGYPLVTSKNLRAGTIDFSTCKLISKEDFEAINQRSKVDSGDILFAMIGTVGNPILYHGEARFSIKNMALFKHVGNHLNMSYVYWFLYFSQYDMKKQASGGVQSFVSLNYLRNHLIPLPPVEEQARIVEKIEEILPNIDGLKM